MPPNNNHMQLTMRRPASSHKLTENQVTNRVSDTTLNFSSIATTNALLRKVFVKRSAETTKETVNLRRSGAFGFGEQRDSQKGLEMALVMRKPQRNRDSVCRDLSSKFGTLSDAPESLDELRRSFDVRSVNKQLYSDLLADFTRVVSNNKADFFRREASVDSNEGKVRKSRVFACNSQMISTRLPSLEDVVNETQNKDYKYRKTNFLESCSNKQLLLAALKGGTKLSKLIETKLKSDAFYFIGKQLTLMRTLTKMAIRISDNQKINELMCFKSQIRHFCNSLLSIESIIKRSAGMTAFSCLKKTKFNRKQKLAKTLDSVMTVLKMSKSIKLLINKRLNCAFRSIQSRFINSLKVSLKNERLRNSFYRFESFLTVKMRQESKLLFASLRSVSASFEVLAIRLSKVASLMRVQKRLFLKRLQLHCDYQRNKCKFFK